MDLCSTGEKHLEKRPFCSVLRAWNWEGHEFPEELMTLAVSCWAEFLTRVLQTQRRLFGNCEMSGKPLHNLSNKSSRLFWCCLEFKEKLGVLIKACVKHWGSINAEESWWQCLCCLIVETLKVIILCYVVAVAVSQILFLPIFFSFPVVRDKMN